MQRTRGCQKGVIRVIENLSKTGQNAVLAAVCSFVLSGAAWGDSELLCDRAARIAAAEAGVPSNVLLAITRAETGRAKDGRLAPWPWTVNAGGKGVWFATRAEALAFARKNQEDGKRNFDVGCFQINYRWHGNRFTDLDQMFEPIENARYAAEFLSRLYSETGDWSKATAAYHSRTPEFADRYMARFNRIMAGLPGEKSTLAETGAVANATPTTAAGNNQFPYLFKGQKPASLGSLVPIANRQAKPLFRSEG